MRSSLFLLVLLCAGCHSAHSIRPQPAPSPVPSANSVHEAAFPMNRTESLPPPNSASDAARTVADLENQLAHQNRLISALIEQNEVLLGRVQATEQVVKTTDPIAEPSLIPAIVEPAGVPLPSPTPSVAPAVPAVPVVPPLSVAPLPSSSQSPAQTPPTSVSVSDDHIPLLIANADGVVDTTVLEAPNPEEPRNPFVLGQTSGATRDITLLVQGIVLGPTPGALVNSRVFEPGDVIESLRLTRIEPGALIFGDETFRLKLTPAETPVRVRLRF